MVAILDTFQTPIYLKRVWTIYEQFIAYSSDIPVTFLMPEASSASLLLEVSKGSAGISFITQAVSQVDSARAEAWKPEDERMVKDAIRRTVGFEEVDKHVKGCHGQMDWTSGATSISCIGTCAPPSCKWPR